MSDHEHVSTDAADAAELNGGAPPPPIPDDEDERLRTERIIARETRRRREAEDFGDPNVPEPPD